jgi:hypothetical protein
MRHVPKTLQRAIRSESPNWRPGFDPYAERVIRKALAASRRRNLTRSRHHEERFT